VGSYILDCREPDQVWVVPSVPVAVVDPTGAGNAYSAAIGYNLAALLPPYTADASADTSPKKLAAAAAAAEARREAVIQSACRASATGAAVVAVEGMPVCSVKLENWLEVAATALRDKVCEPESVNERVGLCACLCVNLNTCVLRAGERVLKWVHTRQNFCWD
jgi:hypothetical protein